MNESAPIPFEPMAGTQTCAQKVKGVAAVIIDEVSRLSRVPYKVAKHANIFEEGDEWSRVLINLDGWLATYKSFEDGEIQILDFILPGDVIVPAAGDGRSAAYGIEAITEAKVVSLPAKAWNSMLGESERLQIAFDHMQRAAEARHAERLLRLGKGTASVRIAYMLLETCMRLRASGFVGEKCEFHLPLAQKHIGDFCGLSSVHVCRTLRRMARHGIVSTTDHIDVKIIDVDALAKLAKTDPAWLVREITPAA